MTKIKEINHQIHLLFQQYGIKSLTMDDLASKLGCSKKTLYIYYENRADLVHKVISQNLDEHLSEVQAVFNLKKYCSNSDDLRQTMALCNFCQTVAA